MILVYLQNCATTKNNFGTFPSPPKDTSCLFALTPHPHLPAPGSPNLLSVSVDVPFRASHIRGLIQCYISGNGFPSLFFESQLQCYLFFPQTSLFSSMSAPHLFPAQSFLQLVIILLLCLLVRCACAPGI